MISRKSPEAEISEDDIISCIGNLFDTDDYATDFLCIHLPVHQSSPVQDQHGGRIKRTRKTPQYLSDYIQD